MTVPRSSVSLRDVASRAGVSVKTVSNVVNGYVHVTAETRSRVQAAIDELGYRPNLSARALRGGRSGVIALAVPELSIPYFAELASAVVRAAEEQGWTVLIDQTDGDLDRERVVVTGIRGQLIDGVIYSPIALSASEIAKNYSGTPLVLLGERVSGGGPIDHVAIDNEAAARDATTHLLDLGRRRIAAIGYQQGARNQTARLRATGYERALRAAGVPVRSSLKVPVDAFHRADGAAAVARLLESGERPDAMFCFNDMLALGAMRALHTAGVRVPEDVAVVGWDDVEEAAFASPSLTSLRPDKDEIARVAIERLLTRVRDRDVEPYDHVASHELVVRESTGGSPGDVAAPLSA